MNLLDFGAYLRGLRIRMKKPLRIFCKENGLDSVMCSKLERGMIALPKRSWLEQCAVALNLVKGSREWVDFFEHVKACSGVSVTKKNQRQICQELPVILCGNRTPTKQQLEDLVKIVEDG